jgi:molybdenum cofactor guanylyltransferase
MGRDKAMLEFEGKPLWQQQLNTLRQLQAGQIFVSARRDPAWRPHDTRFVGDIAPSRGPLSGISAALHHMVATHLLVLAIDMPLMTAEYLSSLVDCATEGRGIIPMVDNRAEPLAAVYPREAAAELSLALETAEFSLQTVARALIGVGKLAPLLVPAEDHVFFRNVNEPADLEQL